MNRWKLASLLLILAAFSPGPTSTPAADPPVEKVCKITLGPRTACVTPTTSRQARADGGIANVELNTQNAIVAVLTGTVAANAILGCESVATQTFHVEQEFEIVGPDPADRDVSLTMESTLIGLVRAKHKGSAAVRLASAKICPFGWPETPLVMIHPPLGVGGTGGRLCNQRLPLIKVPTMPTGRYILTADLVIAADAAGVADGHSAADFSPSTTLPADWVRSRDPFQGVDKKDFGFLVALIAEPTSGPTPLASTFPRSTSDLTIMRTTMSPPTGRTLPVSKTLLVPTGIDRHSKRH